MIKILVNDGQKDWGSGSGHFLVFVIDTAILWQPNRYNIFIISDNCYAYWQLATKQVSDNSIEYLISY